MDEALRLLAVATEELSTANRLRREAQEAARLLETEIAHLTAENARLRIEVQRLRHRTYEEGVVADRKAPFENDSHRDMIVRGLATYSEQWRELVSFAATAFEHIQTQHSTWLQERCCQLEQEVRKNRESRDRDGEGRATMLEELRKRDEAYIILSRQHQQLGKRTDLYRSNLEEMISAVGPQYSVSVKDPFELRCKKIIGMIKNMFRK